MILFSIHAFTIITGSRDPGWERDIVEVGVVYMIGVAGISHVFFGPQIQVDRVGAEPVRVRSWRG